MNWIYRDILLFKVLTIIFYVMDVITEKNHYLDCNHTLQTHAWLILHHFVNTFLMFGWISHTRWLLSVYLFVPIGIVLHWKLNRGKCIMTTTVNRDCRKKESEYFHDILYLAGLKHSRFYPRIHYALLLTGWLIGMWRYFCV